MVEPTEDLYFYDTLEAKFWQGVDTLVQTWREACVLEIWGRG